jgi:hypothetical protein
MQTKTNEIDPNSDLESLDASSLDSVTGAWRGHGYVRDCRRGGCYTVRWGRRGTYSSFEGPGIVVREYRPRW